MKTTKTAPRALIIDDDPDSVAFLRFRLRRRFPHMEMDTRLSPDAEGDYDLYFLDNEFHGQRLAGQLASSIRARRPQSLIIAFSAHLDAESLKQLVNAGCDGACDKSDPDDLEPMLQIVNRYVKTMSVRSSGAGPSRGLIQAIQSITELIRQWNQRLEADTVPESSSQASQEKTAA